MVNMYRELKRVSIAFYRLKKDVPVRSEGLIFKPGRPATFLLGMWLAVLGIGSLETAAAQTALPSVQDVSAKVADPGSQAETLLQMAAVSNFIARSDQEGATIGIGQIEEDLQWLRRLVVRNGKISTRSPVLDPAAWQIHLELEQRQLQGSQLISTLGPGMDAYLEQVFDRSSERLASVVLPELLWQLETDASRVWGQFSELLGSDEDLRNAFAEAHGPWIQSWQEHDGDFPVTQSRDLITTVIDSMDVLVANAIASGPPDRDRLFRIRFNLLSAMPTLEPPLSNQASAFIRLASLVDGLHERRYFSFSEGLLAQATALLDAAPPLPDESTPVIDWLATNLPLISERYARNFSMVDPRINSVLATAFDVVKGLGRTPEADFDTILLRSEVGDAAAQLALLVPDLDYYFNLPVRDSIAGGMDACTGMMASREDDGSPAMTRELFDDCQQSLVELADREARAAALAGDPDGPFGEDQLARELSLTPGQRINYGIGYLHDRYSTGCMEPSRPLPNALEWSALATLLAWFAEQSPVYFQTPENEARLQRMRSIGNELLGVVAEQVDCFAGASASLNDPITRSMSDYRNALSTLGNGINEAVIDFRSKVLAPGADIVLKESSSQETAFRPDKLLIGPCDQSNVCEMSGTLSSTRALWGLFQNDYLIAEQTGLGEIEICYENMSWDQRRSEYVRPDDTNVANYYGHLQFELKGRYRSGDNLDDIFGFRFTSPGEHHYLFAAATDEVLSDECPVEWIGQRIVTPLRNNKGGVVPNRLTYLAAPRQLPSRLLSGNWDRGAEWRDWFITGIGVERLELETPRDISAEVNQQLQNLYRAEQAAIYQSALRPAAEGDALGIKSLIDRVSVLNTNKALIRQQFMLFYPQLLNESDELRTAVAGQGGLLDSAMLTRFKADNVAVDSLNQVAFERLDRFQQEWANQAETIKRTGSISGSLAHAMMRLNVIYQRFFAEPVVVPTPAVPEPAPDLDPDLDPEQDG